MKAILTITAFCISVSLFSQTDVAGSGRALSFDGVDDYVNLGNIYDDLDFPFTVSAWVKTSPDAGPFPIMVTQDNNPIYNGFWFVVNRNTFFIEYGDGRGENLPAFRRGKTAQGNAGEWVHLCAVVRGVDDISVYYNGQDAGGDAQGGSHLPMASHFSGDECKLGYFLSNGIVYRFRGMMDELRLFNRILSVEEIRQQMCIRLNGTEAGLIGYWNFDETFGMRLIDSSPNHFDGRLMGNPRRVFSGAPVGNKSKFLYTDSWNDATLTMVQGMDSLVVSNVQGKPFGVHIYQVQEFPSQYDGIPPGSLRRPYYGVFLAADDSVNTFNLQYHVPSGSQVFDRLDNTESVWSQATSFIQNILFRIEVLATKPPNASRYAPRQQSPAAEMSGSK